MNDFKKNLEDKNLVNLAAQRFIIGLSLIGGAFFIACINQALAFRATYDDCRALLPSLMEELG